MGIFFLHYLALSKDIELEKWMTGGRTRRMAIWLPSMQQGCQNADELMVVKIHLVLQRFLWLGAKTQQILSG